MHEWLRREHVRRWWDGRLHPDLPRRRLSRLRRAGNTASIRAFEKAGFRRTGEFVDPEDGQLHAVVQLDRDA
jgi:hypothetical protein